MLRPEGSRSQERVRQQPFQEQSGHFCRETTGVSWNLHMNAFNVSLDSWVFPEHLPLSGY
jgi:hypothetical protein